MAWVEKNECYGCATSSYPCMGDSCPNRHARYLACDQCGVDEENEDIYLFDDDEVLCAKCLLSRFDKASVDYN